MHGLDAHLQSERCPHLAVFLRSEDELLGVLASFYALAVARGGWLAHRSLPGAADSERELLTQAGCDVARLEADGQMVVVEMDFSTPPEESARPWEPLLEDALRARTHRALVRALPGRRRRRSTSGCSASSARGTRCPVTGPW